MRADYARLPESVLRRIVLMKLHAVGLRAARCAHAQTGCPGDVAAAWRSPARSPPTPTLAMYDEPFAGSTDLRSTSSPNLIRPLNELARREPRSW